MTKIKRLKSFLVVPLLGLGLSGCHLNVVSGLTVNGDGSITQTLTYTADQEMEGFIQQRGGMPNMTGWHETENTEDDGNTVYTFSSSMPAYAVDGTQFYAIRDNGKITVSTSGSNMYRTIYHITGTVPSLNQAMQNDGEGENVPANMETMADSFFTVHFTIHTDQGTIQSNGYSDPSGATATWDLSWTRPTSVDATVASWNMTAVWRTVAAAAIVAFLLLGLQAWRRRRESGGDSQPCDSRPLADPDPERGTSAVFKWQIAAASFLVIALVVVGLLFLPRRKVLPPATVPPKIAECQRRLYVSTDGNRGPLTCSSGALNTVAWQSFADETPHLLIMRLGEHATLRLVVRTLCKDLVHQHSTGPIETSAYTLAALYYGWHFSTDPEQIVSSDACWGF
jgi:hypothetical protein